MNSKDETEGSKYVFPDSTPRLARQIRGEHENLYREYVKIQEKLQKNKESLSKIRSANVSLEREANLAKANLKKVLGQKQAVEKELLESKEYSRKLEQKIAMGAKGKCLGDINTMLQVKVQDLKREKSEFTAKIQELEETTGSLKEKTRNLSLACALKAEDFGITGKNPEEILISLASATHSLSTYKSNYEILQKTHEKTLESIEELQIIRESNNEELNILEEKILKLQKQNSDLLINNKEIALDRGALLQCLEEMSAQQKQYEMDIEYIHKELEISQQKHQEKVENLIKEIQLKDEIIKAKADRKVPDHEISELKIQLFDCEKENSALKIAAAKQSDEILDLKKEFEVKEKRLKGKLAMCFKELEKVLTEKEENQIAMNRAVVKCTEKLPIEERVRTQDDTLLLLSQAKQKNLDLLKLIS